jgi:hypothetical protein
MKNIGPAEGWADVQTLRNPRSISGAVATLQKAEQIMRQIMELVSGHEFRCAAAHGSPPHIPLARIAMPTVAQRTAPIRLFSSNHHRPIPCFWPQYLAPPSGPSYPSQARHPSQPCHPPPNPTAHPSPTLTPALSLPIPALSLPTQPSHSSYLQLEVEKHLNEWMQATQPPDRRCSFTMHTSFLRYYGADRPGSQFQPHVDSGNYTFVISLPSWQFFPLGERRWWLGCGSG